MARPAHLDLDYFEYGNGDIDIYRRIDDTWTLWVLVRDSAAMARAGARGKGLYAARPFRKGDFIGRYVGKILGKPRDPQVASRVNHLSHTLDGDAIVTIKGFYVDGRSPVQSNATQEARFGTVVFSQPEWTWPGVYAHIANDATGTGLRNNCLVTPGGYLEATKRVPGYNFDMGTHDNATSELLWSYGDGYWSDQKKLGTARMPIVIS